MITVSVDWLANGTFADYGDDITADVLGGQAGRVGVQYGREAGGNAPTTAGSGGMTLNNRSRKYSSRNTASPLYGKIKPARPVKITRTVAGTTYTLFRGHTDETPLNPETSAKTVSPSLVDRLGDFRGQEISTTLFRGIRTGEAIGYVLDYCGWTGGRDIDPGSTVIPWWWEDGTDALTALDKIVRSEGFPAMLTMGSSDEVVFRDRFHRASRTASLVSQGTWRSTGKIQPVMTSGFTYDDAWQNIVNKVSVTVDERVPGPLDQVWISESPVTVLNGTSKTIWATFSDPVYDIQCSVADGDFVMTNPGVATTYTVSLTRTSGASVGVTITVTSGTASFASIRVRGRAVVVANTVTVSAEDTGSQADYGVRSGQGTDLPWCGVLDAQSILDQMVNDRADPLPVVTARFVAGSSASAALLLARNLSDRVTIVEAETGLNDAFHIEQIQQEFSGEYDHELTFTLEKVPPNTPNVFILGTSLLGTGVLG